MSLCTRCFFLILTGCYMLAIVQYWPGPLVPANIFVLSPVWWKGKRIWDADTLYKAWVENDGETRKYFVTKSGQNAENNEVNIVSLNEANTMLFCDNLYLVLHLIVPLLDRFSQTLWICFPHNNAVWIICYDARGPLILMVIWPL